MFGSGDLFTSSQGGNNFTNLTAKSPEKKGARQEEKMSCLPVTVRTIESAVARATADSSELRFFGEEQGMLVVVAFAETVVMQAASLEMSLNDSTGRIKARHYWIEKSAELDSIKPGSYVSLVGNVRTSPEVHFAANSVHVVESADEVSYHMIESAHAALKLQRTRGGDDPMTPAPKRVQEAVASPMQVDTPLKSIPGEVAAPAPTAVPASKGPLSGDALNSAIMAYLRSAGEGKEEGLSLDSFCSHLSTTDAAAVRGALTSLVDAGDLYNTIGDDHFAIL